MTRTWAGWDQDAEDVEERVRGLETITKGYGGADLRMLCTEAALNAVQRRYPQIYNSTERSLLKAETINVGLPDFMISKEYRSIFSKIVLIYSKSITVPVRTFAPYRGITIGGMNYLGTVGLALRKDQWQDNAVSDKLPLNWIANMLWRPFGR